LENINAFNAFEKTINYNFELEIMPFIDIDIDLDSMAWDSLFGNSFSEKVAAKFQKKVTKKINREVPKMLHRYENSINGFRHNLDKSSQGFANTLDKKISFTTQKIQAPLLSLLLKAVKGELGDKDQVYVDKMLEIK